MSSADLQSELERLSTLDPPERSVRDEVAFTEADLLAVIDELHGSVMADLDRALAHTDAMIWLADRAGLVTPRIRARCTLAHALSYANRFDEAIARLDEAEALANRHAAELDLARIRVARVQPLARLGQLDEALECCDRASDTFDRCGEPGLAVKAVTNGAILLRMLGRQAESVAKFDRAMELASGDDATRAQIASNRAEALLELGRYAEAEADFRQSADALESAGLHRVGAIVRGNLADLLGRQGRLSEAIPQFEHARRFFESDNAPGDLARLEAEHADVLAAIGLHDEAIRLYERAVIALGDTGLVSERARAQVGLGAELILCSPAAAEASLMEAEAAFEGLGQRHGQEHARLLRAEIARSAGDAARTHEILQTVDDKHLAPIGRVRFSAMKAALAIERGDREAASKALEEGLGVARSYAVPSVLADLFSMRAQFHAASGNASEAADDHRRAVGELDRARGAFQSTRLRAAWIGERRQVSDAATSFFLGLGPASVDEAFEVHERARARSLLDQIRGGVDIPLRGVGESSRAAALADELAEERARLNMLYAQLDPSRGLDGPDDLAAWTSEIRSVETRIASIEGRLEATGSHAAVSPSAKASDVRASLASDAAVLSYALLDDGLACFIVRPDGIACERGLIPADVLDELVGDAVFQLRRAVFRTDAANSRAQRRLASANASLAAVHDRVIRPIADHIADASRLLVAAAGPLHLLPFGALRDADCSLVERYAIRRVLSATLAAGSPRKDAAGRELVLGVPDDAAPEMQAEAQAVASVLGLQTTTDPSQATARCFIDNSADASLVHLCCHGMFVPGNPLASALRFSDRWLSVRETFGLRLAGASVVLSGCDTGRVEADRSDEVHGFVRGFLAAGASEVVCSLWKAHDRATRDLMVEAHADRSTHGGSFTESLRTAQRVRARSGVHPGLWAGFVSYGVSS